MFFAAFTEIPAGNRPLVIVIFGVVRAGFSAKARSPLLT